MNLEFQGQERIPAAKEKVWAFIVNPANIAACLPDVQNYDIIDDRNFDATVQVAVGPVRGKLKFHIALDPQPDGERMNMKIAGGGFGSVLDLLASADVKGDGDVTVLDWQGTATMRGPIATIGVRVLDAQARNVIATTFANVKQRVAGAPV